MNEYLERARAFLKQQIERRSPRERWLLVAGVAGMLAILIESVIVSPLRDARNEALAEYEQLESDRVLADRMAPQLQRLRAEIALVEGRIQPGRQTDLLRLLEQLASQANIKDRLESIRPRTPSRNPRYPEARVEVQLRGATLSQTKQFLFSIEQADLYLIVRSVSIKVRSDENEGSPLLDVNLSVSSFERA